MNKITGSTLILRFYFTTETIESLEGYKNYPCENQGILIKEWTNMKLPDKDLLFFNIFCIGITLVGLGFAYKEYITGWTLW